MMVWVIVVCSLYGGFLFYEKFTAMQLEPLGKRLYFHLSIALAYLSAFIWLFASLSHEGKVQFMKIITFSLDKEHISGTILAFSLGLAFLLLVQVSEINITRTDGEGIGYLIQSLWNSNLILFTITTFAFLFFVPVIEEFIMRFYLIESLLGKFNYFATIIIVSLIEGIINFHPFFVLLAVIKCLLYFRFKSLIPPIIFNGCIVAIACFA